MAQPGLRKHPRSSAMPSLASGSALAYIIQRSTHASVMDPEETATTLSSGIGGRSSGVVTASRSCAWLDYRTLGHDSAGGYRQGSSECPTRARFTYCVRWRSTLMSGVLLSLSATCNLLSTSPNRNARLAVGTEDRTDEA